MNHFHSFLFRSFYLTFVTCFAGVYILAPTMQVCVTDSKSADQAHVLYENDRSGRK